MHKNGARCSLQYQPKQAEIRPNFVYHAQPPVAQCPFDPGIMTFLEHAVPYIESKPEAGYYDPDLEMKYAKVDEGIVVLYMTEWYLCVPADTAISD